MTTSQPDRQPVSTASQAAARLAAARERERSLLEEMVSVADEVQHWERELDLALARMASGDG